MAHGKALGQYRIIPITLGSYRVWDIVDGLGNVVCWSFKSQLKAVNHIINELLPMEKQCES